MLFFSSFPILVVPAASPSLTLLVIETGEAAVELHVELADTAELRQRGLMHRQSLAPDSGMLFDYHRTRPVQMWMKNTDIALDMLFIDNDGRIAHIVENTTPSSLDIIDSRQPVRAVLEVNAGMVKRHDIAVGDRVRHAIFDRR